MIYDDWVFNFIKDYQKEIKINVIVAEILHSLQFNDMPSFELIKSGEADCVAAAAITSSILSFFFPKYVFKVVSLPRLPWINEVNDRKHCALVQFFNNIPMFIIDPTPINGYGYGKISKKIKIEEWQKIKNGWKIKKQEKISKCKFWENHLYPEFLLMTEDDIRKIFEINNVRYFLKNNVLINIKCNSPKNSLGWIKEYWRTKALLSVANKKIKEATRYYEKALKTSPHNPYLLEEIIYFCKENKIKKPFSIAALEKDAKLVIKRLIKYHREAIATWNNKKAKCLLHEDWEGYLYYLGIIFWRNKSISLLKNEKMVEIPVVKINRDFLKISKLSPSWFKNNQIGVLISGNKIINKNVLFQMPFKINKKNNDFYDKFLKIKIKEGYVCLVKNNYISRKNIVYEKLLAHYQFLGLISPELIIL